MTEENTPDKPISEKTPEPEENIDTTNITISQDATLSEDDAEFLLQQINALSSTFFVVVDMDQNVAPEISKYPSYYLNEILYLLKSYNIKL